MTRDRIKSLALPAPRLTRQGALMLALAGSLLWCLAVLMMRGILAIT